MLAALSMPAVSTAQSALRSSNPTSRALTSTTHTLNTKNSTLISMNTSALISVSPSAAIVDIACFIVLYSLLMLYVITRWLLFIFFFEMFI